MKPPELPTIVPTLIAECNCMGEISHGPQILAEHKAIASALQVEHPYWDPRLVENTNTRLDFRRGPFTISRGTLGTYQPEEVAVFIDATLRRYVQEGLFGDFPWNDESQREQLTASMIAGFASNRLIVAVHSLDRSRLIGGCMIAPGENDTQSLLQLNGDSTSTLPTLWALDSHPNGQIDLLTVQESEAVCYTRFFRTPIEELYVPQNGQLGELNRIFSMEVISGMALTVAEWADCNGRTIKTGILDTHSPQVAHVLLDHYGAILLDTSPTPSTQVMATPLAAHYRLPGIATVGFLFSKQLEIALQIDRQLGEKLAAS